MPTPYHVRLAVSQYGEQFRAELFTEDLGDTEGDVMAELPPSVGEWVPYLAQGAELPPDSARQLGKELFAALLGQAENAKKWQEVLARAARKNQPIRLLIDATSEAVRDLPFGLLCEPHDDWFLFRGNKNPVEFVRILRRCSPRPLKLPERPRVLIAVAEPRSADVPAFDAARRLQELVAALHATASVVACGPDGVVALAPNADPAAFAPYTRTSREQLRKALAEDCDIFHLLAHGHGAGVLLCRPDGAPAETTAGELAAWCGAGKTPLAFLQVCKAGQTAGRGGFGGVAQQLLNPRGGNLAAVVASTFPLDAEHSTEAAIAFYRHLAAGASPEEALSADGPETNWCWAFLELWARPGALGGTQARAAFQFVSPYRGLSSFGEQDADLFFGRRAEVTELTQILRTDPVVAVVGDSGSGKTSLLQAGLVSAIRRDGLAGSDRWKIVSLRPGYRPAQALLAALTGATAPDVTPEALRAALRGDGRPLLVVFDQFEELFTLARDKDERLALAQLLAETVETQRDRFRLVLGMRSEFLGQAASVPGLSRLIRRPWVLRPPNTADLRDIVAGPAEHCGYTFEKGLLDRILADPLLTGEKGTAPLPLLQFALERLWLKAVEKGTTEFTHAEFDEIGGMGKAIAQHAEAVFQAAPTATEIGAAARPLAEQLITALVSARGTRQPRSREALQAESGQPDAARAVVDYLVGERLLTVRGDPEDLNKSLVDLSHEALIQNWDRLRGWLAEDPQGRAMREEFRTAAEKWEAGVAGVKPKSRFGLPGADVARNFLAWIDTSQPKLSPAQREFAAEARGMLARRRRLRGAVVGLLAGLSIAASIAAAFAVRQAGIAKQNETAAKKNEADAKDQARRARINATTLALEGGYTTSAAGSPRLGILGIANALALCPDDAPDLRNVILTNLAAWGPHLLCLDDVLTLPDPIVAIDPAGKIALLKRPGDRPDDKVFVGGVTTIYVFQLYDIDSRKALGPAFRVQWLKPDGSLDFRHAVEGGQLLPDGTALLIGGGNTSVWDAKTGKPRGRPIANGGMTAALRPDGKQVAASDGTGNVRLYDPATGMPGETLVVDAGDVYDVAYSADGRHVVSGGVRKPDPKSGATPTVRAGPAPQGVVALHAVQPVARAWRKEVPNPITCVQIGPEQKRVSAGGFEVHTWDIAGNLTADGQLPRRESVTNLVYDPNRPDSFLVGVASGAIQIHHPEDDVRLGGERLSPQGWLAGAGFRRDGRVFTANSDGTVRLWNRPQRLSTRTKLAEFTPPNSDGVLCAAFHPNGRTVVLGTRTGLVYTYKSAKPDFSDIKPDRPDKTFHCTYSTGLNDCRPVADVRFSTDGSRIIAHDGELAAFVFDAAGGPAPLVGKNGRQPQGVAHDGRTAIVPSRTFTPYFVMPVDSQDDDPPRDKSLFPRGTLATLRNEAPGGYFVRASRVAFSPDGGTVALLNTEGRVFVFRTATGAPVGEPIEHLVDGERDRILSLTFCSKGKHLLTASLKARGLWDAGTAAKIDLLPNRIGVQVVRFSPGGGLVLGATNFSMGQAWDTTGKSALPLPLVHTAQVWGVAADPDEKRIVTASDDRSAIVWDRATGRPLSTPLLHRLGASDAAFSPDGTMVLTASWDGSANLWPVPAPLKDEPERIRAWVETLTGLSAEAGESRELLKADAWRDRKKKLDELGGPPIR